MTSYQEVPLNKAYLLLNHGPTVMVSSAYGDKRNIMSVAWNSALDFSPPKVMVVIDKLSYSSELITTSGVNTKRFCRSLITTRFCRSR